MTDVFQDRAKDDPITEFVMPIVAGITGKYEVIGTGVAIGNGLLLTAKHVLDWASRTFSGIPLPSLPLTSETATVQSDFSLQALQKVNGGKVEAVWDILQSVSPGCQTDLTLFKLTPRNERARIHKWRLPRLSFVLPATGTEVCAYGYHSPSVRIGDDKESLIHIDYRLSETRGPVVELHGRQRDISRLNFSCFRFDAQLESTMSGGPILDDNGRICGLVCQTLKPTQPQEAHVSYGTALWPLLAVMLDEPPNCCPRVPSRAVYDLAREGTIDGFGWERAQVTRDERGRVTQISMRLPKGSVSSEE